MPTSSESSLTSDSTKRTSKEASLVSLINFSENFKASIELEPPAVGTRILLPPKPPSEGNLRVIESQYPNSINLFNRSAFLPLFTSG